LKLLRFTIISFVFILGASGLVSAEPRTKTVELTKITHLVVEIVPDLGTRFTFPFVLDEADSAIPFTMVSTNKIFQTERKEKRNTFVVLVDREKIPPEFQSGQIPAYFGNIFVTAGDYMVTIELRTTNSLKAHFTDIVFKMGKVEEEILIQKVIDQRIKTLEADYEKKLEEIDKLASQKVIEKIGELAITSPKIKNIKEEKKERLDDALVVLYVDRSLSYGPFVSFVYEIENQSDSGLTVSNIRLLQNNEAQGIPIEIQSQTDLPPRLMADQKYEGVISVTAESLSPDELLTLEVITNKGKIETTW